MLKRFADTFLDPIRRRNVFSRCVETLAPSLLVLFLVGGLSALVWSLAILAGEFILYEYVLEPLGFSGHYWERGPRDGETFTRW